VSRQAAAALERGHPWFLNEGAVGADLGCVVQLVDDSRKAIAWGLVDEGAISVRILGRGEAKSVDIGRLVHDRILRADRVRLRLLPSETDAYRLINGAGDGLPGLVVDRYAALAVVRLYSRCWEPHLDEIVAGINALPWVEMVWRRFGVGTVDGRKGGEALAGPEPPASLVVVETGVRMLVRPEEGQKTGLFLDQRDNRARVGRWAAGRQVANLFSYTGGFSVHAALGGAARVITVDIAPMAIEDAKENFRLNGLDPNHHAFETADVFGWKPQTAVDMLIVDPPSLARTQKAAETAARTYKKLHRRLGGYVPRDGLLVSSSCTARVSAERWKRALIDGLSGAGDWSWHWMTGEPIDHPVSVAHEEAHYLKFALLRRR